MTRLYAALKDFQLIQADSGQDSHYHFRIARCDSFDDTLSMLRQLIPFPERSVDRERAYLWRVTANARNHDSLSRIFNNFAEAHDAARRQIRMF